ncbi:MAG TPA: 4'-phosphopantetheinyl transferase superfamily protein [Baekduia sp.]|uniref:holo-ACP synthase n=1 Tax=Baekduia sp. TaxID=2600305 RepID=UPI002D769924|nr:4'-phosphopantetheinyl transferase superfamily protein [Baekduia sp.]HET6508930.1 4'-phosphopantetheinyl transferase superfamily protein [Baekduia sp.]
MPLRVGIDLVRAATVAASIAEHGDAYLRRVYTPQEVADCRADPLRLAARFAAKEAAMKVLRPAPDTAVPWPSIEVVRNAPGPPTLRLHGPAAELARAAGLTDLALSFTHEEEYAAAVVVGT